LTSFKKRRATGKTRLMSLLAWEALLQLMDRGIEEQQVEAIIRTLKGTPGGKAFPV
jgi:divalent metal cation (Fe/Co/Zn/Cd) transporter